MNRRDLILRLTALAAFGLHRPSRAWAQSYPNRIIRLVVPFAAGGSNDIIARLVAERMGEALGQSVVVDNRPGAGGTIGAAAAAKSPGDGYTLFFASTSTLSIAPSLYSNPGYDPRASFAPISLVTTTPFLVIVHPSVPARSLRELIKLAKAKPGELYFGSGGSGTPLHIAGEMFKTAAGVNIVHVPYKTISQTHADFIAGQTQILFQQFASLEQYIRTEKLRPLAVASGKRHTQLPDLPTAAEPGMPGYEVTAWFGIVAPAGTPPQVIGRLNAELLKVLQRRDARDALSNQGFDVLGNSPEEFSAFIASESTRWSRAVRTSGAKVD